MTPRISLIAARPHLNPGMYSVDLAFDRLAERHGLRAEIRRYCYGGPHRATGLERHVLEYESLEQGFDDVLASDLILYWGDFHHAYVYWRNALRLPPHAPADDADGQAETALAARLLLLEDQPDQVLDRTLSFGTTLIGDDLRSRTTIDSAYREAFPRFVRRARRIWFRDPISAAQGTSLRTTPGQSCLGVDCAQLLTGDDLRALAGTPTRRRDYVGIYFGRVDAALDGPAALAGKLSRASGLGSVWIPWLSTGSGGVDAVRAAVPALEVEPPAPYEHLLALVAGARLVVTDAYHLCVVAWQLGVPAICVGLGAQRASRPISDKKKEIFYLTQGISPLYVFHEELTDRRQHPALVRTALDLALDPTYVDAVVSAIAAQAATAEADLWSAMDELLA
jgi:hypothetical protein